MSRNPQAEQAALKTIDSMIARCEKARPKFAQGTSQHSLLKNRVKALRIARGLLQGDAGAYGREELEAALAPVRSIIHKCQTARRKYPPGSSLYGRFTPMIDAMSLAEGRILAEIEKNQTAGF